MGTDHTFHHLHHAFYHTTAGKGLTKSSQLLELGFLLGALPASAALSPLRLLGLAKRNQFAELHAAANDTLEGQLGPCTTVL
jgi:hypothetical protein